jgi:hypothetical protein
MGLGLGLGLGLQNLDGLGTRILTPTYRVIVVAGQSNAVGRTAFTTRDSTEMAALPNIKQYPDISSDSSYRTLRGSVLPLYLPENTIASNYHGPAEYIARSVAAQHPHDIIVIIPVAWGSTTLVTTNGTGTTGAPQWIEPSGNLNVAAVNQVNAFMAAYPTAVLHSIHWIQGENDAGGSGVS